MLPDRFTRGQRPETTALTARERRLFRQVLRGLRATDPHWYAAHCPRALDHTCLVRYAAAVLASTLMVTGALTGFVLLVLCGLVLAVGVVTSHAGPGTREP